MNKVLPEVMNKAKNGCNREDWRYSDERNTLRQASLLSHTLPIATRAGRAKP